MRTTAKQEKLPTKTEPRSAQDTLAETGIKGVVDLTKHALEKAPPLMRGFIYVAGIGALLCLIVAVLFIAANEPSFGFGTLLCGMSLLIVALIGLVAVLNRTASGTPTSSAPMRHDPAGPIWSHFREQIEERGTSDLLVHTFYCPEAGPTPNSELNYSSVYRLWADPRGGEISARLSDESKSPYLEIHFTNSESSWPSNVTIRPGGLCPYQRKLGHNFLRLEAKAMSVPEGGLSKISLCFRIVDRLGTQWVHRRGEDIYLNETVSVADRWTSIALPLNDPCWQVFKMDGNHLYAKGKPDIDEMILALVIELGSDLGNNRPGPGAGCLRVRQIRCSDR